MNRLAIVANKRQDSSDMVYFKPRIGKSLPLLVSVTADLNLVQSINRLKARYLRALGVLP